MANKNKKEIDDTAVHMGHCNKGEYKNSCKYGDSDCPAIAQAIKGERMEAIVKGFQKYVRTYTKQLFYKTYSDETFIDDMLYGIGIELSARFNQRQGYEDWKKVLVKYLKTGKLSIPPKEM